MNHSENTGPLSLLLSCYGTMFAWVTLPDVQVVMTLIATGVSIISGAMAGYYYFQKSKQK